MGHPAFAGTITAAGEVHGSFVGSSSPSRLRKNSYSLQSANSRETSGSGLSVELYVIRSFFTRTFAAVGVNAIAETNTS
jgi:hypothetical protein